MIALVVMVVFVTSAMSASITLERGVHSMTEFPNAQERVRPLLDTFLKFIREWTGNPNIVIADSTLKTWLPAARDLANNLDMYGVSPNDWPVAFHWMLKYATDQDEIVVKTPRSIVYLIPKYLSTKAKESKDYTAFVSHDTGGELVPCPRCGKPIFEERAGDDCLFH